MNRNFLKDQIRGFIAIRIIAGQDVITKDDLFNDFVKSCSNLALDHQNIIKFYGKDFNKMTRYMRFIANDYGYEFCFDSQNESSGQYINPRLQKA